MERGSSSRHTDAEMRKRGQSLGSCETGSNFWIGTNVAHIFWKDVQFFFVPFSPGSAADGSYDERDTKASHSKIELIAANVQKFRIATREVRAFKLISATKKKKNLSMITALYIDQKSLITNKTKDIHPEVSTKNFTHKELLNISKLSDD